METKQKCCGGTCKSGGSPVASKVAKAIGRVRITEVSPKGDKKVLVEGHNVVTNGGYNNMIQLLGGASPSTLPVSYLLFGAGTAAATQSDTALGSPYSTPTMTPVVTYPATGQVLFAVTLGSTVLNGFPISEVGLFSSASPPVLLAHYVFSSQTKQSGFVWLVNWAINFAIS